MEYDASTRPDAVVYLFHGATGVPKRFRRQAPVAELRRQWRMLYPILVHCGLRYLWGI